MQRVTRNGLRKWDDLDPLSSGFQQCDLNVSYRQTERLFKLARDLYSKVAGEEPVFKSAWTNAATDPAPLAKRCAGEFEAEDWIADRIVEICNLHNGKLPATAVLVPRSEDVSATYDRLLEKLSESGIEVDKSEQGQNLGDSARVRVFPIESIKGLEFECAFFLGIDRMADVHEELVDKYFYVGLSRARSFLAVTYKRQFPQRLHCIASHFEDRDAFQV